MRVRRKATVPPMANVVSTKPSPPGPAGRKTEPGPPPQRRPSAAGLGEYLHGVREELAKAKWPTKAELYQLTKVVLGVIFAVALYVGALDMALGWITQRFLGFGK